MPIIHELVRKKLSKYISDSFFRMIRSVVYLSVGLLKFCEPCWLPY